MPDLTEPLAPFEHQAGAFLAAAAEHRDGPVIRTERQALRLAISDPGAYLPRGDNFREPLLDWQYRAVHHVIAEYIIPCLNPMVTP